MEGQPTAGSGRTSNPVNVRVGGHSYDRSYAEIESVSWNVSGKLLDLRLRWGQTQDKQLVWLCTPLNSSTADPCDFELRFVASYTWMRAGTMASSTATGATFESYGLGQTTLAVLSASNVAVLGENDLSPVAFATTPLAAGEEVGLTSDPSSYKTAAAVKAVLDSAAAAQTRLRQVRCGWRRSTPGGRGGCDVSMSALPTTTRLPARVFIKDILVTAGGTSSTCLSKPGHSHQSRGAGALHRARSATTGTM